MSLSGITNLIDALCRDFQDKSKRQLGYPVYAYDKLNKRLAPLLKYMINNLGDPFAGTRFGCNTMDLEQDLIKTVASWYRLNDPWGYVTSGGTEGNICGIHYGLEKYPDAVIYASDQSHYSIRKAANLCRAQLIELPTYENGELDYSAVANHSCPGNRPAILVVNYGTVMKGAIDDIDKAYLSVGRYHEKVYVHVDAALFGLLLPHVPLAPQLKFSKQPIDSVAVSGHKFLGTPFPCGVFLSRQHTELGDAEYIDSRDATITGSRNGLAVVAMALKIDERRQRHTDIATNCIKLAEVLMGRLQDLGVPAWKNEWSNVVVFPRPNEEICKKWQLATQGDISHVIVMPHVDIKTIEDFAHDVNCQGVLSGELLKID